MSTDDLRFESARILGTLQVSPSELGYRVQALFAETLARMGVVINAIARSGHPDVMAQSLAACCVSKLKAHDPPTSTSILKIWKASVPSQQRRRATLRFLILLLL